jgi:CBS domain-containing protein
MEPIVSVAISRVPPSFGLDRALGHPNVPACAREVRRENKEKVMKVSDLMPRQVTIVRSNDSAATAARLMWDGDCGSLPVVDEGNQVSALVTDRDLCMAALFQERPLSAIPISQAMSKSLHLCGSDDSLSSAEQIMRAHQIGRLPVLDAERRLLGILSLADIVCATERNKGRKKEMIPEDVTATLADICTRRAPSEATT